MLTSYVQLHTHLCRSKHYCLPISFSQIPPVFCLILILHDSIALLLIEISNHKPLLVVFNLEALKQARLDLTYVRAQWDVCICGQVLHNYHDLVNQNLGRFRVHHMVVGR